MSEGSSLPFPDLTGLRTRANDRHLSTSLVQVEHDLSIAASDLEAASKDIGELVTGNDLITLAWTVVLLHILSPEDACTTSTLIIDEGSSWTIGHTSNRSQRRSWRLADCINANKSSKKECSLGDGDIPDNVVVFSQPASSIPPAAVTLYATREGQRWRLRLQASPQSHSEGSARLHLTQIDVWLASVCSDSKSPAFDVERFGYDLRAGENFHPISLQDDFKTQSVSSERFEYQFEKRAAQFPDRIALDFRQDLHAAPEDRTRGNVQLTYSEVDTLTSTIARHLIHLLPSRKATGENRIVALCLEKSQWTYLAIMAVLKADATWCPIDTDWPEARRRALLTKSRARLVLTAGKAVRESLELIAPEGISVVSLDTLDLTRSEMDGETSVTSQRGSAEDLAYLIWTSGTTGLPKAVGIQHKAAVQALRSLEKVIPYDSSNTSAIRYLQFSAYNFDLMILDMFYTWGLGGTLCSSTRSVLLTNLVDIVNTFEATHTLLTPAVMAMTPRELLPTLQVVINGGEKLSQVVADMWSVNCCLLNLYGPAEATLIAMNRRVPVNDVVKAPNIGQALPTTSCHALDSDDNIVIKGAVGQLVLGGFQCALGYIGDEDKTADKFVEHGLLGRIYKTGDMVRQLWNGDFEYLGRSDDQVKINGIRIELLEINAAIRSAADEVLDSETLVLPNEKNDSDIRIVNFSVVPSQSSSTELIRIDEEAAETAATLIQQARKSLPSYMVPSLFLIVNRFPKTSSAKIDREGLKTALKEIDVLAWQNQVATCASSEEQLDEGDIDEDVRATIAQHIASICDIAVEQIGLYTPLSSLGLDSIRAIALVRRLNEAGVNVSVVDVLTNNTVALLLRHLKSGHNEEAHKQVQRTAERLAHFSDLIRADIQKLVGNEWIVEDALPATPLQESLIAETRLDRTRYWLHRVFLLDDAHTLSSIQKALEGLVRDFDILRTTFVSVHDLDVPVSTEHFECAYIQAILETAIPSIKHFASISGSDESVAFATRTEHLLDISAWRPPVAFSVVQEPPRLIMHIHHALYDQISLETIQDALNSHLNGSPNVDATKSSFAKALPLLLKSSKSERDSQLSSWDKLLDGYPKGTAVETPQLSLNKRQNTLSEIESYKLQSSESYDSLAKHSAALGCTPRAIAQAVLCILLSRLSNSSNVLLGDAISGRAVANELDSTVGPVLATLPVFASVVGGSKFSDLCEKLLKYYNEALPESQVSLAKIRQILQLPRSSDTFQAMFVFEPPTSSTDERKSGVRHIGDYGVSVEHKLAFEISFTKSKQMTFGLLVRKGSVDSAMAKIVLEQYQTLMSFFLEHPDADVCDLSVRGSDVMAHSRYSPPEYLHLESSQPVYSAFAERAHSEAGLNAVEVYDSLDDVNVRRSQHLTYGQLYERSSLLAKYLKTRVPDKCVVAVTLTRSLDTYVALMAILMAGCVYLPIDVTIPQARKVVLLRDSKAACLICQTRTDWIEDQAEATVVNLDQLQISKEDQLVDLRQPLADDAAYILYTSGSTGTPKGCQLSHGSLSATIAAFRNAYNTLAPGSLDGGVRFLARSVESFDVSLLEVLLPLQIGGTIVTAPRQLLLANLGRAMHSLRVTHAAVVPSLFTIDGRSVRPKDLPDLRALIVGGERIRNEIITDWASSSVPLLNAYGPTEACIGTSISRVRPDDSTGIIGKPFVSTKYLILSTKTNAQASLALRGEAGELCIGGMQVGSYLNNANADSFVTVDGMRYYRTGDEARMWHDDTVEYLGRTTGSDAQVKIRGVRIELGEIDAVFSKLGMAEGLNFTTQLADHPQSSSKKLVTFFASSVSSELKEDEVALRDDQDQFKLASELLSSAKKQLPSSMTPVAIIPLVQLPLASVSGKVNRNALQHFYSQLNLASIRTHSKGSTDEGDSGEFTENELSVLKLASLFVREADITSPRTDLFTVGLDSLKVIQLAGLMEKQFRISIDLGRVMADASIRAFASFLDNGEGREANEMIAADEVKVGWQDLKLAASKASNGALNIVYAMPCLPLQASMIAQSLLDFDEGRTRSNSRHPIRYVNLARFEVTNIDRFDLEKGLEAVLSRHDIYRTVFLDVEDAWVQAILESSSGKYRLAGIDQGDDWFTFAQEDIIAKIGHLPPIRYQVKTNESGNLTLDLALHHAVYDGVSLTLLLDELSQACRGGEGSISGTQFADVVAATFVKTPSEQVKYWKGKLSSMTVAHFPCLTGHRQPRRIEKVESMTETATASLSEARRLARRSGVTLPMMYLHAFASLYGQYTGDTDVILGLVLNGRQRRSSSTHGPCVNTVPFGVKLDSADCLKKIKLDYGEALEHQHVSLTQLGRELEAPNGLFNSLFSFITEDDGSAQRWRSHFKELHSNMLTGVPLALEIKSNSSNDTIQFELVYHPAFIPNEQASFLLKQLEGRLTSEHTDDTAILSISNVQSQPDKIPHFLDFFAEQVALRPDHTAFEFATSLDERNTRSISYKMLDDDSQRIASALSSRLQGRTGVIIGVFMSQCSEVYATLLGLWKASAVYLPLDPKLPTDRLDYIVTTARPELIITNDENISQTSSLKARVAPFDELVEQKIDLPCPIASRIINSAAYLMFTSGSSGKPKGVQVSHRALGATLLSWREILPHTPGKSRMLQLASPGFDVFLIEVCMPLAFGFTFASAPKAVLLDDLEATFNILNVTIADLPAALAVTLEPSNVPRLEWLMSGGDLMDQRVIDRWTDTGLINAWGPTEATIGNTLGFVRHRDVSRNWIGYAYPTSTIFVLDPNSNEILPSGCLGELAVGGPQVGDGYFGNETLTNEKFVEILVPGSKSPMRAYRTGDVGRLLYDGGVECLGRMEGDGQVKINSQRVELKEIEIALCKHADVQDACVLYLKHQEAASKQLVAFLVIRDDHRKSQKSKQLDLDTSVRAQELSASVISHLSRILPPYMVPGLSLVLDSQSLPLTPNDKTDLKALKTFFTSLKLDQIGSGQQHKEETGQTWTDDEKLLRKILASLIGVEQSTIHRDTSLHRLGVDSISAIQVAKRMRAAGVSRVSARDILSSPSIEMLAQTISGPNRNKIAKMSAVDISEDDVRSFKIDSDDQILAVLPCTALQEGMLLQSIQSRGQLYVHRHAFRINDSSNVPLFVEAIEGLIRRHEMLRTSFHAFATPYGAFVQAVHSVCKADVDIRKRSWKDETDSDRAFLHGARFDDEDALTRPAIQVRIVQGVSTATATLTLHHALYDGESLERLFSELEMASSGETLADPATPFRNIVPHLLSDSNAIEYWAKKLQSRQDCSIRTRQGSKPGTACIVKSSPFERLDVKVLEQYAKAQGVSVHTVALFSFSKLLAALTERRDLTFAQLFSLRDAASDVDGSTVIGPCLNTCLTPVDLFEHETIADALRRLQNSNDEARRYRNASLADVQRRLMALRGSGAKIEALFDMQRIEESSTQNANTIFRRLETEDGDEDRSTQYALNLEFVYMSTGFGLVVSAHTSCFDERTLDQAMRLMEEIALHTVNSSANTLATEMPGARPSLAELPMERHVALKGDPGDGSGSDTQVEESYEDEKVLRSPLQRLLLRSIAELADLKGERIDVGVPLSRLGMDSIASMRLASRLRKSGVKVGLVDIVQGKTVNGILRRLQDRQDTHEQSKADGTASTKLNRSDGKIIHDLMPGQLFQLADHEEPYTFYYRLAEGLKIDTGRLERAWSLLCQRHECLRTGFEERVDDTGFKYVSQVVWSTSASLQSSFKVVDALDPIGLLRADRLQDELKYEALEGAPNRACFFVRDQSQERKDIVVLRLHHALYDAVSLPILLNDLSSAYAGGKLDARESPSVVDLVGHVNPTKRTKEERLRQYWSTLMSDVEPCLVGESIGAISESGESFVFLRNKIKDVARLQDSLVRHGVDHGLPAIVLAAWAKTLAEMAITKNRDAIFGVYRQGRSAALNNVESIVGNCMNILPVVVHSTASSIQDLAHNLQLQLDEQQEWEDATSLVDLLRWTGHGQVPWNSYVNLLWPTEADATVGQHGVPQFEVIEELLTRDNSFAQQASPKQKQGSFDLPHTRSDLNIDVQFDKSTDALHFGIKWRSSLFAAEQIGDAIDTLCRHIQQATQGL